MVRNIVAMADSVARALDKIAQRQRDLEDRRSNAPDDSQSAQHPADLRQVSLDLLDIDRQVSILTCCHGCPLQTGMSADAPQVHTCMSSVWLSPPGCSQSSMIT